MLLLLWEMCESEKGEWLQIEKTNFQNMAFTSGFDSLLFCMAKLTVTASKFSP
jgi:hypothetical protein